MGGPFATFANGKKLLRQKKFAKNEAIIKIAAGRIRCKFFIIKRLREPGVFCEVGFALLQKSFFAFPTLFAEVV